MSDAATVISNYIAAYRKANPSRPPPVFEGPNARGWYEMITSDAAGFHYSSRVRCGAIKRMTKVLQNRAKEESNA